MPVGHFILSILGLFMIPDDFMFVNFWYNKTEEKTILKIIEWAHKSGRVALNLTQREINEAVKAQNR
jgi:hypothetical protein